MKRTKKNQLWYNAYGKEIGGILLEGREAALRCRAPCPDPHAGLRPMGMYPEFQTTIL